MPVLNDWDLAIDADKVLWGQGADPALIRARGPKLAVVAEEAIAAGSHLLAPAVRYPRIPVAELRHERLLLAGGGALSGPPIADRWPRPGEVIVAVCTVGDGVAGAVSEIFKTDPVGAHWHWKGWPVRQLRRWPKPCACHFDALALTEGLKDSIPLNPGMIGGLWQGQAQIFKPA